jgi:hypothetical protein
LPEAYNFTVPGCEKGAFVLGPYMTACGGCDRLLPFDIIPQLIRKYAARGHVIFEGVIVGSIYGQVGAMMEQWGKDAVLLILDTSLEECISRVESRRRERADMRDLDPKNLTTKYKATLRVAERVKADGIMQVRWVKSETAHLDIIKLLQGAKWNAAV